MTSPSGRRLGTIAQRAAGAGREAAAAATYRLDELLGGSERRQVIVVLACVLGLSGADMATVGASATELRHGLHITNTDIGLLVTVSSLVAAVASLPFGVLADRTRRTRVLGAAIVLWGAAMIWSAAAGDFQELLLARLFLGAVTAAAGPFVASLVGDYFTGSERGRVYGFILTGELLGAGFGFAVTGDIAALSWRAAFVILALPAFALAWFVSRLPEPRRGGAGFLVPDRDEEIEWVDVGPGGVPAGSHGTDAQRLARERGVRPDPDLVLGVDARRMRLWAAARYVLRVRTNVVLIAASSCGYYFLAGVETFGSEFREGPVPCRPGGREPAPARDRRRGGRRRPARRRPRRRAAAPPPPERTDRHQRLRGLGGRRAVSPRSPHPQPARRPAVPRLRRSGALGAEPASGRRPARHHAAAPLGRAEAVRTLVRSLAQALAPLLFGVVSDHVFGGGRTGLQWTFVLMVLPLAASAALLFRAMRTYPQDVATAAAALS